MNMVNPAGGGLMFLADDTRALYERIVASVAGIADQEVGGILGSALRDLPMGAQRDFVTAVQRLHDNLTAKKLAIALSECAPAEREQYRTMTASAGLFGAGFHGGDTADAACALAAIIAKRAPMS